MCSDLITSGVGGTSARDARLVRLHFVSYIFFYIFFFGLPPEGSQGNTMGALPLL